MEIEEGVIRRYFEWIITYISVRHHQGPVHIYLFLFELTEIIIP